MYKLAYSISEVVAAFGVGRTRVFAEIASGRLLACKIGRRTVIRRCDLDAWLARLPARIDCMNPSEDRS